MGRTNVAMIVEYMNVTKRPFSTISLDEISCTDTSVNILIFKQLRIYLFRAIGSVSTIRQKLSCPLLAKPGKILFNINIQHQVNSGASC